MLNYGVIIYAIIMYNKNKVINQLNIIHGSK